jgi:hypothetical protein
MYQLWHGWQFGSVKVGSATELAVPRTAVGQCHIWQNHEIGSAKSVALPTSSIVKIDIKLGNNFASTLHQLFMKVDTKMIHN